MALPDTSVGEIMNETLYLQPRPAGPHARAITTLTSLLVPPFDHGNGGPGGWLILFEPECHMHEEVLVPDLAGWRRGNLPRVPEGHRFTVVPDWVCEVLSPSTARLDRTLKMDLYAREGVAHVWLVDTAARTVESYELQGAKYLRLACDAGVATPRMAPFDAVALELKYLWDLEDEA